MAGRVLVALAIAAVVTGACAGGEPDDAQLSRPSPTVTSTTRISSPTSLVPPTAPDPAVTSTTGLRAGQVVLGPEGLGVAAFGDPAEDVVDRLSDLLGRATDDHAVGSCPTGQVERVVEFAELAVLIGDRQGSARFVAWDLAPPSGAFPVLQTAEGVGVGTTIVSLGAAYGDRLRIIGDDPFGPSFEVRVPAPGRLSGTLTGTGPSDTVATLGGGVATCGE